MNRLDPNNAASVLSRLNPTVKAALLLGLGLSTFTLANPKLCALLAAAGLAAAVLGARVGPRALGLFMLPFATFGLGLVVVNATTRGDEALCHLGSIEFTRDGALVGLAFALRGAALGAFTLAFLASTPPRALLSSLMRHARLSPRYAFALLAGHRALLLLPERWVQVRRARWQRLPAGDPRLGVRGFAACAFALLTHAIRDSERIALALESRGLGAGPRTELVPSRFTRADALVAALGALALVALGWAGAVS
ncbi:energy-coupling factor transporter transmembrane protein EcfT [Micrococcales bacterium 31B]|nr:energy-coupling factor transporter transmembrane protein EcfT [Micrococcales bacterium 31B]